MTCITANDITIAYDSFGPIEGCPVVLISGTQMIRWAVPFCEELAALGYRVIRIDNRDSGHSTHFSDFPVPDLGSLLADIAQGRSPHVPYTLHDMAADVIGLLDALGIKRAHFVGRSMGGMIAQLAASEYPDRVLSLTSIMSCTGNPELPQMDPDVKELLTQPAPNPFEEEAGFVAHRLELARRIASPRYPFDEEAHCVLAQEEVKRSYDPAGFARQFAAIVASGDLRTDLGRITAPTLVIHGANDPLVSPAGGRDTAACIEGAELMLIEGMGHDLPFALHRAVADAIARNARRSSSAVL